MTPESKETVGGTDLRISSPKWNKRLLETRLFFALKVAQIQRQRWSEMTETVGQEKDPTEQEGSVIGPEARRLRIQPQSWGEMKKPAGSVNRF
ncbi:unnamed protein product [Protopolystoma xenopodis]|uniref:Uncharacterized protein n=1 Tax=Protopolystoma xenopodis TaxID=117903 RepID=A0A3S5CD26_9PLAT|nr:unnamed protein product [Protopolystoma xenopodis]